MPAQDSTSTMPQTRSRAISLTRPSTGVSSASQVAARHRPSNDLGSRRSYATVARPENPPASVTAVGSPYTEYTAPPSAPPNPQANETPIFAQSATALAQEGQFYSPKNTFQETSPPNRMPGDVELDAAESTHRRQQQPQQGDGHRSTSASSGGYIASGLRSLVSGSIDHMVEDEMNRTKEKLRAAKAELDQCNTTLENYKRELQRSQGEVRALARSCHELKHDRQRLAEANQGLQDELNVVKMDSEVTRALSNTRGEEIITLKGRLEETEAALADLSENLKSERSAPENVAHTALSSQVDQEVQHIPCPECQISQERLCALERRFEDAQVRFSQQRMATRVLLREAQVLPYTDLLDKVETFNKELAGVAALLMKNIVYRAQEAFQEELDEAYEEIKPMIGGYLSDLLVSQSRKAGLDLTTPPPLFARTVVQTFLVAFCASDVLPRSAFTNVGVGEGGTPGLSREYHQLQPSSQIPSTAISFKSKLLGKLSTVLKVAAWAMPGSATRVEFASRLKPLFEAKEDLRVAISETFASANIELVTVDNGALFSEEFMQDAYPDSSGGSVVGTVAVGLKKSIEHDQRGSILRSVIPARVVLQSSLELAVIDQIESHQEEGGIPPPELSPPRRDGSDAK